MEDYLVGVRILSLRGVGLQYLGEDYQVADQMLCPHEGKLK